MTDVRFDPEHMLSELAGSGVRFVLIGGMAAILHGDVGVTVDLDITPAADRENLDRLAAALRALGARIRADGVPGGLPFDCSGAFLANLGPEAMLNLTTPFGDIDLAFSPSGTHGFADLRNDALTLEVAGVHVLVASLADIVRSKAAADREKDRRSLPRLYTLLERTQPRRSGSCRKG